MEDEPQKFEEDIFKEMITPTLTPTIDSGGITQTPAVEITAEMNREEESDRKVRELAKT
mgnify:CR=1 FL=1